MSLTAPGAELKRYHALLGQREYRLLFAGQAASQFGDWINRVALIVLVYRLTGLQIGVALILLAMMLPRAIVLPFGGVLADRYPKRWLMLVTDLLRGILALSLMVVTTAHGLWWLAIAVVAMQSLAAVFNPARSAILPALVTREDLGPANALNGLASQTAFFVGPALGGLIIARWDVGVVFAANAATFAFSALLLWRMRPAEPPRQGVERGAVGRDLREGWATVRGNRTLRVVFGGLFVYCAVAISLNVTLVGILTDTLGRPAETLGLTLTLVGLGTIVGLWPGAWLLGRIAAIPLVGVAVAAIVLDMAIVGAARSFTIVMAALFVNGVLSGVCDLVTETIVGRTAPSDRVGRVFGFYFWTATLGHVVGALTGGLLAQVLGPSGAVLALSGAFALLLGAVLLLNAERMPTTLAAEEDQPSQSANN